ncbi:restriction endonuclease subunit S [Photobacterium damselae]|uniref:restriction endonuclease subunit S n=1 Tax=Photobacterium damselae TaxID=38293 RepID=UPI0040683F78
MSFDSIELKYLLKDKGYLRGPFGSALKRAELKDTGVPVYEQQHAISGIREFRYFIDDEKYQSLKRFTVSENDLIISCSGTVGRISIIEEEDPKGIISQALLVLRPDVDKITPHFLYYFLISQQGQREILNASQGAVQLNIAPRAVVEKIPVPTPTRVEQDRIVGILKTIDDKIDLNTQTNQTLEQIAQAIFKSWFVDFDPVKAKMNGEQPEGMDAGTASLFPEKLVESEIGLIPEGFAVNQLSDICKNHSQSYNLKSVDEVVFVNTGDVLEGDFLHKDYSPVVGLPGQAKKAIKEDDILYSEIRPKNKRFAYVDFDVSDYVVSTKFMVIQANEKVHPRLLYMILTRQSTIDEFNIIADSRSGTFPQITFKAISNLKFCMAPREIQDAFVAQVMPMIKLQRSLKSENKQLAELRDTLLPKLLSGEINLTSEVVA